MEICLSNEIQSPDEVDINFMPCSINFNGKCKVASYFKKEVQSDGAIHSSFRGRPLLGLEIQIPEGYTGYVLKKQSEEFSKKKVYDLEHTFKKFHYWNLDRIPSKNDALVSAFDWIDVSNALHSNEEILKNGKDNCDAD